MKLSILFPVYNEHLRLESGVTRTVSYLESIGFEDYEILIVDNGSTDDTPDIARGLCRQYERVSYECISEKGVGAAFRRGVALSSGEIVGYMDIDLSANLKHLGETIELFREQKDLEYVNGSRFKHMESTVGRKWYRKITSQGLLILLKLFFGMKCTDAICGFTFLRKKTAEMLIGKCSQDNGWFYMIEFLIRAEKNRVKILDYPVEWQEDYNTTVKVFKTTMNYIKQMCRLWIQMNIRERKK